MDGEQPVWDKEKEKYATFVLLSPKTQISATVDAILAYGHMATWSYLGHMAIMPFGYMASMLVNMGVSGISNKNVVIW